ncbi:AtpZ/AtpI family protein [Candidatus Roizmanbacteria bacterium]|nr:AtpZ/AtpI family protein [Candidatus Roizmanbacteria bacterium]
MKSESHFTIDKKGNIVRSAKIRAFKKSEGFDVSVLNVGYYLITPLLIGVFLGLLIDGRFHTKPIATIIGISLGSIGSFYNLSKFIKINAED